MKTLPGEPLPDSMKALVLDDGGVQLADRPLPEPARGQVLVRMHTSPINPNDLMFVDGTYEVRKPLPVIPGFEGSGEVIAAGGGMMSRYLLGRRVACMAADGDGTWAEYLCTDAMKCAPLRADVELDQGSMLLTNPLTASVLFAQARRRGAFVQNAAAGALGRMLVRLARRHGCTLVNVVRRESQVAALRALGAEHVVVSSSPDASDELSSLCERFDIRFAIDAIAGPETGRLLSALAEGGSVMVYGMLSGQPAQVDADDLVFRKKTVTGFTMYDWVANTSMVGQLRMLRAAQRRLGDDLRSDIRAKLPLSEPSEALARARTGSSEGKILFDLSSGARGGA